jgi:multiple sugar transport system substrate-binding protein
MKRALFLIVAVALAAPTALFASGQAPDSGAKGPYEISILYGGAPLPKQETFKLLIEEFGKTHPNARTEIITVSGNFYAQIKVLAAADNLGDVLRLDDDWTGEHMVYGNVIDLTDRIKKEIKLEDYYLQSWVPFVYKGRIYGVPYDAAVDVIFYNKNHFKEGGLAEPPRDPARWTNEAFLAAAQKLTKDKNGDGRIDQWGFTYSGATTGYYQAQHYLWREGGSLYDREKTRVTLHTDPASVRALQNYVDIRNKWKVAPPIDIANQMGATAMFHSGVVSTMLNANWELPNAEKARANKVIDYGIVYMPSGARGTVTRVTCDAWGITKNARSKDRAWEFVKWMSSEAAQSFMGDSGAFTPPLKKIAQSEAYRNNPKTYYDEGLFVEITEKYSVLGEICLQGNEVGDAWTRAMEALWLGKEDAQAAANRYNELMTPILAREVQQRPFAPSYVKSYSELTR